MTQNRRSILFALAALPLIRATSSSVLGSEGKCWRSSKSNLDAGSPTLLKVSRNPLLMKSYYHFSPGGQISPDGAQGRNRNGIWMIEEQRVGGNYVRNGILTGRRDWIDLGWKILDWGLAHQESSGRFQSRGGYYHSTSLFLGGLETAFLADPSNATCERLDAYHKALRWMVAAKDEGYALNAPYTHRDFLCMSALGRGASITGDKSLLPTAHEWARRGLRAQLPSGINPENGGYDMSYQMVGPLAALHYIPVCPDATLTDELKRMVRSAIAWWLQFVAPDGTVPERQSTRIGVEHMINGKIKTVNYRDAVEALVWASEVLGNKKLLEPAARLASHR